jgi:hypothetical protein
LLSLSSAAARRQQSHWEGKSSGVYWHAFRFAKQNGNSGQHLKITEAGTAKADVVVRVRGRIVQIQRERPVVVTIVPIAAA